MRGHRYKSAFHFSQFDLFLQSFLKLNFHPLLFSNIHGNTKITRYFLVFISNRGYGKEY